MTRSQVPPASDGSTAERLDAMLAELGGRSSLLAHRTGGGAASSISLRPDMVVPAASLAKLCIAVELFRRAESGQLDLRARCDTADEPRVGGGGVLDYLDPTTRLTLYDLSFLMLAVSDNSAANFLVDLLGMGTVNETMTSLDLTHTRLARHFMDFAARDAGHENVTSAGDIVALLDLIHADAVPGAGRLRELLAAQQVADDIREWLPEEADLGHKTGALPDRGVGDGVFHDAGFLRGPAGSCIFCILTVEQRDLPGARAKVGHVLRSLWDIWCDTSPGAARSAGDSSSHSSSGG